MIPDGLANYNLVLAWHRLRAVVRLDVFPVEEESFDLLLLWTIRP